MTPQQLFDLSGKTALVTGGATGIGRMAAEALVGAGAKVLIASRSGDACEAVAAELNAMDLPGSAEGFSGDVGTEEGGELASTPRTLALITHLVVQHVWFNLHLEQDNDGIESSNDKKKQ